MNFLRRLRFADEHLPRRNQTGDQIEFRVVQMERFAVHIAVHLRVGEEDLGRATLGDDVQHARLLQFLDRLRGENHGGLVLAPGLLRLDDVVADGLVA